MGQKTRWVFFFTPFKPQAQLCFHLLNVSQHLDTFFGFFFFGGDPGQTSDKSPLIHLSCEISW